MEPLLRQYFWIINLVVITACALLFARGTTRLVMAHLPPPARTPLVPPPMPLKQDEGHDIEPIIERNLFCSTCSAEPDQPQSELEPTSDEPERAPDRYRLIATLISPRDPVWSFAAVRDAEEDRTGLHTVGSHLTEEITVTEIKERRVLLSRGNSKLFIDLEQEGESAKVSSGKESPSKAPTKTSSRHPAVRAMQDYAAGLRKVGDKKWEIERGVLNKILSNTTLIARSARIVPSVRNDKQEGFKLYAIRPGSFYALLGMRNGDTVNAINGHPITTPDKALEIYTKLRNASHVTISFRRRGKTTTHEYTIR